jgi:hypothetical protein
MILGRSCDSNAQFIVPEGTTRIGHDAFNNCSTLQRIVIPEGVTHIGNRSFSQCINLTYVKLPSTLHFIEDKAFYNCNRLSDINIPENVRIINDEAFKWTNIMYVTLGPNTIYNKNTFDDNTVVNGGILFDNQEVVDNIWDEYMSMDEEDFVMEINEDLTRAIGLEVPDDVNMLPKLPESLHINQTIMNYASNLRPKTINISKIPKECNDPIMFGDENITSEYMSNTDNIVFLKKVREGYKAECFSKSSIKSIVNDETGNYLFFECSRIENISSANTNQIYVKIPIYGVAYMPLEYALNIINSNQQYYLINYMNKRVTFSVNYGVYYQVLDWISAWHCNPGSNFSVSKAVPINIV